MSQPFAPYAPQPVAAPDYMAAVHAFIAEYCLPAMDPAHIFRGDQNRISLPQKTNDYAVFFDISDTRVGSNAETFAFDPETEDDGLLTLHRLGRVAVQIDFYGDQSKRRAMAVSILASSGSGVVFFKRHGLSVLYADDPRDGTVTDGSDQYVPRWITTVHLSAVSSLSQSVGWFDAVTLNPKVVS